MPPIVKVFMWFLVHSSLMTDDIFQKKRPNSNLCSQLYTMCKRNDESLDHLFCIVLWLRLYGIEFFGWWTCWVALTSFSQMLLIDFTGFDSKKKKQKFYSLSLSHLFWLIWVERNARVSRKSFEGIESL